MPVITLQQAQTEVGRIRLGVKTKTASGKERPDKLDRFRFTSSRKALIERIAALYGGNVEPWQPPKGASQWQVITNAKEVPVMVPPQDPGESQWYEMWSAGGCLRRCDGQTETISKKPCVCDPDSRDCKIHTRLRVMLEDVPGLGAWRVDTGSYYAAVELPGVAALLAQASGIIPATLVLDQRTVTRQINGKAETRNFAVPVLHVEEITPGQLVSGKVQELVAARRAAAIGGTVTAISAAPSVTVDYTALIDAARTVDALRDLYKQAKAAGALDDDLKAHLEQAAKAFEAPQQPARPAVIDVEVTESSRDNLLDQILAESPWDTTEALEREFVTFAGMAMREAPEARLRQFLTAVHNGYTGVASGDELSTLLDEADLNGDAGRLFVAEKLGREVESLDSLTPGDRKKAIAAVKRYLAQQDPAAAAA